MSEYHNGDGTLWHCELCSQEVTDFGPWCRRYMRESGRICWPVMKAMLREAKDRGDMLAYDALGLIARGRYGDRVRF